MRAFLLAVFAFAALTSPSVAIADDAPPIADAIRTYLAAPKTCAVDGYWAIRWGASNLPDSYGYQLEIHQLVYLVPDIPYVDWWLPQFADGGGSAAQKYDEDTIGPNLADELAGASFHMRTSEVGRFDFRDVPCGKYVVLYETWTSFPDWVYDNTVITRPSRVWERDLMHIISESAAFESRPGKTTYVDITKASQIFSEKWRGPEGV